MATTTSTPYTRTRHNSTEYAFDGSMSIKLKDKSGKQQGDDISVPKTVISHLAKYHQAESQESCPMALVTEPCTEIATLQTCLDQAFLGESDEAVRQEMRDAVLSSIPGHVGSASIVGESGFTVDILMGFIGDGPGKKQRYATFAIDHTPPAAPSEPGPTPGDRLEEYLAMAAGYISHDKSVPVPPWAFD